VDQAVALAGDHQRQNAALAVDAAETLVPGIGQDAIQIGLQRLNWPGRFEVVRDGRVILDGAHNGASAEALARTLQHYARGRRLSLVVGINRDKDARAVLRPLLQLADSVWATQTSNNPRALPAADLGRVCRRLGGRSVASEPDLAAAIHTAMAESTGLVVVTGSLMLVGQARATLGLPPPERLW
jgi:dihydrofolate synthase/folylpolyglutamate synthase